MNNLLYYDLFHKEPLNYIYPADQRPWLLASSLCYEKQFWKLHGFAEIDVEMDGLFVRKVEVINIYSTTSHFVLPNLLTLSLLRNA